MTDRAGRHLDVGILSAAFTLAAAKHSGQVRKGTGAPYMTHLLGVTELVWLHGGSDVEAAAALLHDSVEDAGGRRVLAEIAAACGDHVSSIVEACSDSFDDTTDGADKLGWRPRKETYLLRLRRSSDDGALLVSACDKLHNLRSICDELSWRGAELWRLFHAGPDEQDWYFSSLLDVYRHCGDSRVRAVADRIGVELARFRLIAGLPTGPTPAP